MPSVNPRVIEDLRGLGEKTFLVELIDLYLKEATGHLGKIRESLASRDAHTLERSAHTLKGSSGNLGALALSRLAGDLQNAARSGDWVRISDLAGQLEPEFQSVRAELEAERAR